MRTQEVSCSELALYEVELVSFVKETQDGQWQKFYKLYPNHPEQKFLVWGTTQLNKADPNAIHREATWNSRVNRNQIRAGAAILDCLVSAIIHIVMGSDHALWGCLLSGGVGVMVWKEDSPTS